MKRLSDNRQPLLLEAAMEALIAITDIGVQLGQSDIGRQLGQSDIASLAYLMDRKAETGMSAEQRLEKAHGKLQEALRLYSTELGIDRDEP